MLTKIDSIIVQFVRGNRHFIEAGKLLTIGLLALLSLFVSIYFIYFSPYAGFRFVYVFIPHLYLIPIILLSLWYPKSGIWLVILILASLFTLWIFADILGYSFPPLFMILYTGIDLAIFVVFLLYVKDRRLVEAVILDLIEHSTERNTDKKNGAEQLAGDFDAIICAMNSDDENIREEAVAALSEFHDERAVFPLITALRDESIFVRRGAAEALGKVGSIKGVKPLISALADDNRNVREASAEALGHLGKLAIPEMVRNMSSGDWRIRMGVIIAMRLSIDQPDTDPIIRMLSDESSYVRREAIKTLGRIGDQRIIPYLVEATYDTDPGVRLRAIRAITKKGSESEVLQVLKRCMQDSDNFVRIRAKEEYEKFSTSAIAINK